MKERSHIGFDNEKYLRKQTASIMKTLKDKVDSILCLHTSDIERIKVRADPGCEAGLRKLIINFTCDPEFSGKSFFIIG
jgi:uncharacterized protein (UPF0371 family)